MGELSYSTRSYLVNNGYLDARLPGETAGFLKGCLSAIGGAGVSQGRFGAQLIAGVTLTCRVPPQMRARKRKWLDDHNGTEEGWNVHLSEGASHMVSLQLQLHGFHQAHMHTSSSSLRPLEEYSPSEAGEGE